MSETHPSQIPVTINREKKRFELKVNDQVAFMEFMTAKAGTYYLVHTEVPASLEGQGVGSALVKGVFRWLEENGHKMVPLCPFVKSYLQRHPDFDHLLAHRA